MGKFWLLAVVLSAAMGLQARSLPTRAQKLAGLPARYGRISRFLGVLGASQHERVNGVSEHNKVAIADVDQLVSFVSARGLFIVDKSENGGRPRLLSRAILLRDLKRTGSSAYDSFTHAGLCAASIHSYKSQLYFRASGDAVLVFVLTGPMRLTWVREQNHLQLRKLEVLLSIAE